MAHAPYIDLFCPGAIAQAIRLDEAEGLCTATVTVTVRLELGDSSGQMMMGRDLEAALAVSMDELTNWPASDETLKRPDGTRLVLPKVDARMRVHRVEGTRDPLQDLPFDVETLAINRDGSMADAGLRAQFNVSDPTAKLIVVIGMAVGRRAIEWSSRDQAVAERALRDSQYLVTYPRKGISVPKPATPIEEPTQPAAGAEHPLAGTVVMAGVQRDEGAAHAAPAATSLPMPSAPKRRAASSPDMALDDNAETKKLDLGGTVMMTGGDEPPPQSQRTSLRIDNPTQLAAWTVPWVLKGKHSLTVVAKGTCDLGTGPATLRAVTEAPRSDGYLDDDPAATLIYPSDHALLKHRADVVLVGRAYAPRGGASRSEVVFRFGHGSNAFERHIAVFGPREWRDGVPSPPGLFESVPLIYERAFGGPAFTRNPVGVGFGKTHRGRFLPSLEDLRQLLTKRGEEVRPACFAPLAPSWERRWRRIGKTWRGRLEANWAQLPDDFNWEHFQCAPTPQQLDYLSGGEPFEVLGVRPDDTPLRGQLPTVSPRCTVKARDGERPLPLHIDTVVIDTEALAVHLIWRGLISVSAPHAPELAALQLAI